MTWLKHFLSLNKTNKQKKTPWAVFPVAVDPFWRRRLVCFGSVWSGVLPPPPTTRVFACSLIFFFLNTCGISSPTRVKSRRTLLSYTGGIVTLPCPVTTRSSVPGSTAQATSPGYRSPPPHQLWCPRDGKAKLVPESQATPLNQSPSTVISHPPPQL